MFRLPVQPFYLFKILQYKCTFSGMESESQSSYIPVHDQTVINGRGSAPLDLDNSRDANLPRASERLENDARGKVSTTKADPKEAGITETMRKELRRRRKQ